MQWLPCLCRRLSRRSHRHGKRQGSAHARRLLRRLRRLLPNCPTGAITFVEREAADYDEEAVKKNMAAQGRVYKGRCPGSEAHAVTPEAAKESRQGDSSQLRQWPVQLKLVPPHAPYFNGARLLIAADCTAYAYARFHDDFIKGHITLIGCPKLDDIDYSEKLTEIIRQNAIQDVTVVRMEVPCCRGWKWP